MTDQEFADFEEFLKSFHDFFRQLLGVLYVMQPPHTGNHLIKALRANPHADRAALLSWRLDPDDGLLHGLIKAYFAVKVSNGWTIPELRENVEQQRLIASCLVHGETHRAASAGLVEADRIERLRRQGRAAIDGDRSLDHLPHSAAAFEVRAFYKYVRPALARLFAGRTAMWLRHGAEEADWRARWSDQPMVSRSKDYWPNFYYPWPNHPDYWAIEVGELTTGLNKPHLVDFFFPSGLMTIEEYRASVDQASILSALDREHEIAFGLIPLGKWIFVFQDHQLRQDRYLVTESGGFMTHPIMTNIIDVADAVYAKLYSIG